MTKAGMLTIQQACIPGMNKLNLQAVPYHASTVMYFEVSTCLSEPVQRLCP